MASSSSNFLTIIVIASFILLVNLTQVIAGESIVLEEGYTVTTVIDGNKLNVNLYAVIPLFGSSSDLVILDNVKSTFYTVSLSDSQVGELKKLAGNANGVAGYKDGDLGSAEFKKPKNFAVDKKNNIYVADTSNHVIRKISKSGVTTIAGGNTRKTGKTDGPAQNASFSDAFELTFDSQRCALLISDHGNNLIRQLDLKAEDCADTSSGSVLGSTIAWSIGVVVTCLVGFVFGFAVRPYVRPYEASGQHPVNVTWKHFLTSLEKQAVTFYFVTRNAIASRNVYQLLKNFLMLSFSQLLLLFGINIIKPPTMQPKPVSLLDCDALVSNEITKPRDLVDELTDMITFDGTQNPKLCLDQNNACYMVEENKEVVVENGGKIDKHIHANLVGFVESSKGTSSVGSSSL
ncbi:putative six-bladed beta-propeller, TolB [Helianthus annuus]|nr:putative six-bladed beta-propeller, TolB [Helianthus annuus]KAJ0506902.1 putative six-bladed beta-propeller, TolB [Helianthus annuus]